MELGAAIMQKDRLELDSCCVNVDIDPVSITYCDQVASLPWPAPLPVRTLLFSTSAAAQLWCPVHQENKEKTLRWQDQWEVDTLIGLL